MTLTARRRRFIDEYLKCWNATEAARRAGYAEKYLNSNASKLLQNTAIKAVIDARLAESAMSADEVLQRLGDQARGSLEDFYDLDPSGSGVLRLDLEKARQAGKLHLIKSITKISKDNVKLELYDAQSALVHLGRHHKLFTDKHEVTGKDGAPLLPPAEQALGKIYGDK